MGEQNYSIMSNLKIKFGHQARSISQPPPTDRSIEWATVPIEFRPTGKLETRVIEPDFSTGQAYDPVKTYPNIPQRDTKRASTPSAPLLQLPRPRATWRRSLEELSPTKKSEWWSDPDLEAQRMTVDIACALPPQYLEHPPPYSDEDEVSGDRKDYIPFHNLHTGEKIPFFYYGRNITPSPRTGGSWDEGRRGSSPLHSTYSYHPSGRDDVTIDSLLSHPLLVHAPTHAPTIERHTARPDGRAFTTYPIDVPDH